MTLITELKTNIENKIATPWKIMLNLAWLQYAYAKEQ